jgi:hypothetical protein
MPRNTRIQLRRGTANQWTTADPSASLAEGEIGYEIDTGRFKIGKTAGSFWSALPYAGGSEIIAQTGIGFIFDNSANAYTVYSYITGIQGGQDGITFETLPLSGLLGNASGSGTYYRIGLSNKLENFHDSNINISGNLISSSNAVNGTGITISGFNNSAISLNPDGGTVTQSGVNIRNLTETVTVTSALGGLSVGTQLTTASGITDILKKMLQQVFEPTVGVDPNFTLSLSNTAAQEIGTSLNLTVSATSVSSGTILGTGLGAGWNSSATQRSKVGAPTGYSINSNATTTSSSLVINPYVVQIGSNTFPITTYFNSGTLPVNSLGNVSTSQNWTSLTAPTGVSKSSSFTGFRGVFYGVSDANNTIPTTSADIRALSSGPVNLSSNATFNLAIPSGTRKIIVAFPSGVQNFTNTTADATWNQAGIKAINGANAQELYSDTIINVSGANNFTAIPYYVKYFIPAGAFPVATNHSITIK